MTDEGQTVAVPPPRADCACGTYKGPTVPCGAAAVGDMRVEGVPDLGKVEMRNSGPNAITY